MIRQTWACALSVLLAGSIIGPASAVSLTVGIAKETIAAYPTAFGEIQSAAIADCLEGLVTEDAAGAIIPGQALSWTMSPDGLTYTFTLREDIFWSNGDPVVAADFVAGLRHLFDPANALEAAYLHFFIANAQPVFTGSLDLDALGVTALDDTTLEIRLEHPVPYFLQAMSHSSAYPLPSRQIATFGPDSLSPDNILCNGAFTITSATKAVTHAVKSARYYDAEAVAIDDVTYLLIDDLDAGLAQYAAGDIDIFYDLPSRAGTWIAENKPDEVRVTPFGGMHYYAINLDKPPFDNPDLRRALSMAIDRVKLNPYPLYAERNVATRIVPPGTANFDNIPPYEPDWAALPLDQRRVEAKALLAAAGFGPGNPLSLTLRYNSVSDDRFQKVAQLVADMWSDIGIEVQLLSSDSLAHYDAIRTGNYDIGRVTWILDFSDPANVLELNQTGTQFNMGGYSNPDFDALMEEASTELDLSARALILAEAEKLLVDDTVIIPLNWVLVHNLVAPRVSGVVENARNVHLSRWITMAG